MLQCNQLYNDSSRQKIDSPSFVTIIFLSSFQIPYHRYQDGRYMMAAMLLF